MTWVYGFQCHDFIKIGVAYNIARRRKQFQLGNPHPLKIVVRCRCSDGGVRYLERRIHELLADAAIGREWFKVTPERARAAVTQAKIDLDGAHDQLEGWRLAAADHAEQKKGEAEQRRMARGEMERAALLGTGRETVA